MVTFNPYLHLKGNAREALEFYRGVFGGEVTANTFKESGVPVAAEEENWLMHGQLTTSNMTLMVADSPSNMGPYDVPAGISLSLSGEDEEVLRSYWEKLSVGGNISQPLMQAPWGDTFGMVVDKFGINWMVNILQKKA